MKPVILYGGSFDPIHNGHLALSRYALKALDAEKVIFILAPMPRFKETKTAASLRLEMLEMALEGEKAFSVSRYEIDHVGGETRSYDTVIHFKKAYPDREIYFLIGFDQVYKFDRWYKAQELSSICHLVSCNRGENDVHPNLTKYHITLLPGFKYDCSSTLIRAGQSMDCPLKVIEYIINHELYFIKKLKSYYSERRFIHAVSVAFTAYKICHANHLEPTKACLAGLYHDIAKNIPVEEMREILKEHDDPCVDYPEMVLHQFVGEILTSEEFGVTDKEILESIRYHTTGSLKMGPYAMIIYASDKIEPTRTYDSSELIRAMEENYYRGFQRVLYENKLYHERHQNGFVNNTLTELTYEAFLPKEGI